MSKYYDLSEVLDYYRYNEADNKFHRVNIKNTCPHNKTDNQSLIIDVINPAITVDVKDYLKNRAKIGNLAEFLFSKYVEREGWEYEHTAKKDDSKGYDFKVYESTEPVYFEIKMLNKDNRFFISSNEIKACSENRGCYKLFLVTRKANFYTGFILDNPFFYLQFDELMEKSLLINGKGFIININSIKVVLEGSVLTNLKSIYYNVK